MANKITISNFENGTLSDSGVAYDRDDRIRSIATFNISSFNNDNKILFRATSNVDKTIQCCLFGFSDNGSIVDYLLWYDSGSLLKLSGNTTTYRIVLRYSDSSTINPEDIEECYIVSEFDASNNLMYDGYVIGCYNGISGNVLVDFIYGNDSDMACYFADLKPNTTYTLYRVDTSSRFRIATYTQDVKLLTLYGDSGNNTSIAQQWVLDSTGPLTFTTGNEDIYLVIYYTNNYEYDTRVMLNEGAEISSYSKPTTVFPWYWKLDNDNNLYNSFLVPIYPSVSEPTYPYTFWKLDNDNELHTDNEGSEIKNNLSPPYPKVLFTTGDNGVQSNFVIEVEALGAFCHSDNLTDVSIPKSTELLGEYMAKYSNLSSITISKDCTYGPNTFPENCEIVVK